MTFFFFLISFLKFVTYLQILNILTKIIEWAFCELASFTFSFVLVFVTFITLFYFLFSADLKNYYTFGRFTIKLWEAILDNIEITKRMHFNRFLAISFFILFTFIFIFIFLIVIIAIINNVHKEIRFEYAELKFIYE